MELLHFPSPEPSEQRKKDDQWFFALQPDTAAREAIVRYQDELAARHGFRAYRLKPQNLHITLYWIGEGKDLPEVHRQAAYAAASSIPFEPFDVTFDHALSFDLKREQNPFVLGSDTGLEAVRTLHDSLHEEFCPSGRSRSRITPHLTLFWDPLIIAKYPMPPIRWTVKELVLIHSIRGRAEHVVVGKWPHPMTALSRPRKGPREYVELHARSAFSFLRGASLPEHLIKCGMELELPAMALLDRDGVYGAPRFYGRAHENGMAVRPRVGAEITMEDGTVVPLLAASQQGYQNLCQLITEAKLTERTHHVVAQIQRDNSRPRAEHDPDPRERKRPCFATWEELARFNTGLVALTGDEEGPVRQAWHARGAAAAKTALDKLTAIFGSASDPGEARLFVELQRHRLRGEERENTFLRALAAAHGLPLLATGGVNYAIPEHRIVADVFTCLRHHTTLDAAGRRLDLNHLRHVKSSAEMAELFADLPDVLENSVRLDQRLDFTLENLGYEFPAFPTPAGQSMDTYLREETLAYAHRKVGSLSENLRKQIDKELELIAKLGFSGYFLIVWDICRWARENNILVQGRGSAANSAVCYMLGITAVNPVKHRLLFDRFLNDSRRGKDGKPSWPDIDLDFPSGERREKVIQEVYERYGRRGAAMTANVVSYRGRNSVREVGKVLGFGEDALDRFSSLYANGDFPQTLKLKEQLAMSGIAADHPRAAAMVELQNHIRRNALPRHLGQHSGGMVICAGQLDKVVPLEPATMEKRSICQWDKDDCEDLGIVKIDFLGLGMMAVMQETIELCAQRPTGDGPLTMDAIPVEDPDTYEKIRAADTVGVFQIESRAQMATLPRFKPKDIYDLAMQVSIVRPGPITGDLVHPLIRRRDGLEKPVYIDPSVADEVEPILKRTMGVILFQEQMLEISMKLARYTGAEAEALRRAMGFTKGDKLTKELERLKAALRREGHNEAVVQKIATSAKSFAAYGFPESHAIGFAQIAYSSTWLKLNRPAEFYASLLNNQPMGFYSSATLLQDAKRGGRELKANPVCVCASRWECTVEGDRLIRIGLRYVKGLREEAAQAAVAARANKPFTSLDDFLRRTDFTAAERRSLAAVGALNAFSQDRRSALWQVEAAWSDDEALFKQFSNAYRDEARSPLAAMSHTEELQADFFGLGLTTEEHPMALLRESLPDVTPAVELKQVPNGLRVTIAGAVICRQRPGTAKGFVFISLEDETGIANAVVIPPLFEKMRLIITQEPALRITGPLQNVAGVQHVKAEVIEPFRAATLPVQTSHDFH